MRPHFRLCMSVETMPIPFVATEQRECAWYKLPVWYDPKASIDPSTEVITCDLCFDRYFSDAVS